mgnify:CR=1 FL=1
MGVGTGVDVGVGVGVGVALWWVLFVPLFVCAMACRRPFGIVVFFPFNSHVSAGLHIICSPGTETIEKNCVVFVTFDCYSFCIFLVFELVA